MSTWTFVIKWYSREWSRILQRMLYRCWLCSKGIVRNVILLSSIRMPSAYLVYEMMMTGRIKKCVKVINLLFLMLPCILGTGEGREKKLRMISRFYLFIFNSLCLRRTIHKYNIENMKGYWLEEDHELGLSMLVWQFIKK